MLFQTHFQQCCIITQLLSLSLCVHVCVCVGDAPWSTQTHDAQCVLAPPWTDGPAHWTPPGIHDAPRTPSSWPACVQTAHVWSRRDASTLDDARTVS